MNFSGLMSMMSRLPMSMSQSPIATLLEDPDVTLDKLLDEETAIVSDFKIQNPKLMQFLKYDKFKKLIEYVTKVGPENEQKRSYKFPFVACDVLTADNNTPSEFLLPEKELFIQQDQIQEIEEEIEEVETKESVEVGLDQFEPVDHSDPADITDDKPKEKADDSSAKTIEKQPLKIKKKVKKEVVKKVQKQVPPLINDLFSYLDEQLNYTLAGYFSRILLSLFTKKPLPLSTYFFSDSRPSKLLNHTDSRSIAQIAVKFLTLDSLSFLKERQSMLVEVITRLGKRTNVNLMCNLSYILCEVIEKYSATAKSVQSSKEMLVFILGEKFCGAMVENILSDDGEVSVYNAPTLLCLLVSIRNLVDSKEQSKNTELVDKYQELMDFLKTDLSNQSPICEIMRNFFEKAVQKLNLTKRTSPTLGMGRIKLLQALFLLIKFNFFNIQTLATKTPYFSHLLQLTREYQLNNVLHNQVVRVITFVLQSSQPTADTTADTTSTSPTTTTTTTTTPNPLITTLFNQNLLNFLYDAAVEDQQIRARIAGKDRRAFRRGYLGHVVKIGQLVSKMAMMNAQINGYLGDQKWMKVSELVERETFQAERNLAGYTTRKIDANNVMFHKEDILALHQTFLSQPPVTTYPEPQASPVDDLEQTINLIEARLHIHDTTAPAPTQAVVAELVKEKEQDEGMAMYSSPNYWKQTKILRYDINDLLSELE